MPSSIPWPTVCVFAAMLLGAVALIWRGLRGRRVGDHPICRRCGFDLFGAPAGSKHCPECGADVEYGRNVVVGRRERRAWPFAVAGALLVLVVLGGIGLAGDVDWRASLPTWYVLYEARTGAAKDRVVPIDQLLARDATTSLPVDRRLALARAILALQRDPANVWRPTWGDWLAQRAIDRTLSAADAGAFWQNLLADATVALRTTIRRGKEPALLVAFDSRRGGLSPASPVRGRLSTRDRTLTIDGVADTSAERGYVTSGVQFASGTSSTGTSDDSRAWRKLAPGPHAVEWACPVRIYPGQAPDDDERPPTTEVTRATLRWKGTVTVVDGDDVRLVPDAALADAMRDAIGVTKLRVPAETNYSSMLELTLGAFPVDVAFDVLAQQGDGPEVKLTTLERTKSATGGNHSIGMGGKKLEPGTATLIFRASAEAARSTVDEFEIWGGEVRVEDVPVERGR